MRRIGVIGAGEIFRPPRGALAGLRLDGNRIVVNVSATTTW
ncbi:MAG TPA: hypothetical protein VE172_22395 [Stackebrandtia sp.]|jgi:hypothetical protein|nr:hypothetical protein [Stackebrandtia sp.]HZE41559.1 hypothetical protein [Stackebrandtia sp.]